MKTSFLFLLVASILIAFFLMNTPPYYRTTENFAMEITGTGVGIFFGVMAGFALLIWLALKWMGRKNPEPQFNNLGNRIN
jgi:uncharacterized oligopeptide transporter (OPT) family protein